MKKVIEIKNRRLQKLEEEQALKGINSPPELLIEIEDLKAEIEQLSKKTIPPHTLEIDINNTLFARFVSPQSKDNGNIGIAFYDLKIINSSRDNFTVKDVLIRYVLDGSPFSTRSHVLLTSTIYDPKEKKDANAIIVKYGPDNIVVMNWNNLRVEISKHNLLLPGGVLSGSAFFVSNFDNLDAIVRLENVEIVILDYLGRETIHKIKIENEWVERAKHALIENRIFVCDEAGNIKFG